MFLSRNSADCKHKIGPAAALVFQHFLSYGSEPIVSASALSLPLDPSPSDEASLFEAVEQWVERGNIEFEEPLRALFDQLANLITVAWALLNKREDKQFCTTLLQFSLE
jgi:hypothetical protein